VLGSADVRFGSKADIGAGGPRCCNCARYNSTLLLRTIFLSGESTLLLEGKLAKKAVRGQRGGKTAGRTAENARASIGVPAAEEAGSSRSPANDNPTLDGLPACLPVTEEEVGLLHRYLGAQILGLFA
jgi:hypothetical protein